MSAKGKPIFSLEPILLSVLGLILSLGWFAAGPSNQELLANYAKAKDLWDLILANRGFAWWSPNYLGRCLALFQP